jgi:short-subunit dehydrogenase
MKLKGRTVIVTGASSGIGRETTREFAKAGSNVVLASRNEAALRELAGELTELAGRTLVVQTDMRDQEAVRQMVEVTLEAFGGVDVLVNNAGVGQSAGISDGSVENMRYVMDVNFFGAVYAIQAVAPGMKARGSGAIVNVSSVMARIATPYNGIYHATKAALIALSDALRFELAAQGITVSLVVPGYTSTKFGENVISEMEAGKPSRLIRAAPASAVARAIVRSAREGSREEYATFGDRASVMLKNVAPGLVDWGVRRLWSGRGRE